MESDEREVMIGKALAEFDPVKAGIAELREQYGDLTIEGPDDREGYKAVHAARMEVRGVRIKVEHTRKALKADALAFNRAVDARAKEITEELTPLEGQLHEREKAHEAEREAIREAERQAKAEALRKRMEALREVEVLDCTPDAIEALTEEEFAELLEVSTKQYEERQEALRKEAEEKAERELREAEKRKREQEELEAEKARQEEERAKLDAERAQLDAERAELEAAKAPKEEPEPAPPPKDMPPPITTPSGRQILEAVRVETQVTVRNASGNVVMEIEMSPVNQYIRDGFALEPGFTVEAEAVAHAVLREKPE